MKCEKREVGHRQETGSTPHAYHSVVSDSLNQLHYQQRSLGERWMTARVQITAWDPERPDIEQLLRESAIQEAYLLPSGSNYVFLVQLHNQRDGLSHAIYKPRSGEAPLWDFPDGTLYRREFAAYLVACALGWNFIPPTVIREGPHGIGVVELFIIHKAAHFFTLREHHADDFRRMAVFDIITNNADRKAGHCLEALDGRIWGIDHGLTFHTDYKLRTVIWDYAGERVPEALCRDLERLLTQLQHAGPLYQQLEELLARREIEAFVQRIENTLAQSVFPAPGLRRSVPWPML